MPRPNHGCLCGLGVPKGKFVIAVYGFCQTLDAGAVELRPLAVIEVPGPVELRPLAVIEVLEPVELWPLAVIKVPGSMDSAKHGQSCVQFLHQRRKNWTQERPFFLTSENPGPGGGAGRPWEGLNY